jgi:peptide/nickel transport system substrate-binding protein
LWWLWWSTVGKEGEEPPADVKAYCNKMFPAFIAPPAEGAKAHAEAYKTVGENYWLIIPAKNIRQPFISSVKLGNQQISEQAMAGVATKSMEMAFFKE